MLIFSASLLVSYCSLSFFIAAKSSPETALETTYVMLFPKNLT